VLLVRDSCSNIKNKHCTRVNISPTALTANQWYAAGQKRFSLFAGLGGHETKLMQTQTWMKVTILVGRNSSESSQTNIEHASTFCPPPRPKLRNHIRLGCMKTDSNFDIKKQKESGLVSKPQPWNHRKPI
jgi:hypothetical protein